MKEQTKKDIGKGILIALSIIGFFWVFYQVVTYDTNEPQFEDICKGLGYERLTDYYRSPGGSVYRIECDKNIIAEDVVCFDGSEIDKWGNIIQTYEEECDLWYS